jgi:hypothetical protein
MSARWALLATLFYNSADGAIQGRRSHEAPLQGAIQVGDVAEADLVTPISLSIPDAEETDRVRREIARNPTPVLRFCPGIAEQAEARFRASFQQQREHFLAILEKSYGRRKLNRVSVNHSSFARFVNGARGQHGKFPLPIELAGAWALGEAGEEAQDNWAARLGGAMERYICSEAVDETIRSAFEADTMLPKKGRVVAVKTLDAALDLNAVERNGVDASITELRDLARARDELIASFSAGQRNVGAYLGTFVQPNALMDIGLTRAWLEQQATNAVAHRRFRGGDLVVRKGEVIDETARMALAAIDEHRRREERQAALAEARRELIVETARSVWHRSNAIVSGALGLVGRGPWLVVAAGCGAVVLWIVSRRKTAMSPGSAGTPRPTRRGSVVPSASYTVVVNPDRQETIFLQSSSETLVVQPKAETAAATLEEEAISGWREQVVEAERRVEDLLAQVRAGLAPELAKQMMDRLVQQLLAQRKSLLTTYATAADHVAALERRFTTIHEQLQNQLRTQEQRASDLQQKLATKDLENSELLRAVLDAQKKLGRPE